MRYLLATKRQSTRRITCRGKIVESLRYQLHYVWHDDNFVFQFNFENTFEIQPIRFVIFPSLRELENILHFLIKRNKSLINLPTNFINTTRIPQLEDVMHFLFENKFNYVCNFAKCIKIEKQIVVAIKKYPANLLTKIVILRVKQYQ